MNIILGSASRWRQALLRQTGIPFQVMVADIDERSITAADPQQLVLKIAQAKAAALLPRIDQPSYLITLDQTITCADHIHNKPQTAAEARLFLQRYGQHPAISHTAIVITHSVTGQQVHGIDQASVNFTPIPEHIIDQAIAQGDIFHCAGAFQVEGDALFQPYIRSINGDLDSIQGLPRELTLKLLKKLQNFPSPPPKSR